MHESSSLACVKMPPPPKTCRSTALQRRTDARELAADLPIADELDGSDEVEHDADEEDGDGDEPRRHGVGRGPGLHAADRRHQDATDHGGEQRGGERIPHRTSFVSY